MKLVTILSFLPCSLLRRLVPQVRLMDLRHSVESAIVEAWLSEPVDNGRILVIGGNPLLHLPLARRGATLVGLVPDAAAVEDAYRLARRMGIADQVHFHVSNLLSLPFPTGHFDAVLCGATLARSTDDLFILREMARVLKSGGILGLTLPSFEAAGSLSERLPKRWLADDLRRAMVTPNGSAPQSGMTKRVRKFMREREHLRRFYRFSQISTRLDLLGLEVADHGPYLTRLGAAVYEAFHTLSALDRHRTLGRWLYATLSPFLLAPVLILDAASQKNPGFGLRLAAIKRNDNGNIPHHSDEGGGLEIEWRLPEEIPTVQAISPQ